MLLNKSTQLRKVFVDAISLAGGPLRTKISGCSTSAVDENEAEAPWENPYKYALPREASVDWSYVERLIPPKVVPEMPKDCGFCPVDGVLLKIRLRTCLITYEDRQIICRRYIWKEDEKN
uniref:Uncharacterized protein n=1 Tax=Ditylenchus dipsaci TaxID=166011 RepID=A0A915EEG2_9BILA